MVRTSAGTAAASATVPIRFTAYPIAVDLRS
jgi:hypothetical protein